MRVTILKSIASVYGPFYPGMVADVPEGVAKSWCAGGIAKREGEKPVKIPKGMYWCTHCLTLHREDKKKGQRHLKYSG